MKNMDSDINALRKRLNSAHSEITTHPTYTPPGSSVLGGWRGVAALPEFDALRQVSTAPHLILYRIAVRNEEPTEPHIRQALGLPMLKAVPVCTCGEVHLQRTCPYTRTHTRKQSHISPWIDLI